MSRHSILLDLPAAVLAQILATFVATTKEIGKLDSACCSHADRGKVLALLSDNELVLTIDSKLILDILGCMRWSVARKVRLEIFKLTERVTIEEALFMRFFHANRQHLTEVHERLYRENHVAKAMLLGVEGTYPRLKVLDIHGNYCMDVSKTNIAQLFQKTPNLEQLVLHCRDATVSNFIYMDACCPKVTTITIDGSCVRDALHGLHTCFPNLDSLELNVCISPLSSVPQIIASCRRLRKLTLSYSSHIQDEQLVQVAQLCPQLTYVTLDFCSAVTADSVTAICTHCTQLESLFLQGNSQLPVSTLTVIATYLCHTLKHLNVGYCLKMGEGDMTVLRACTLLESLDISKVEDMKPADLLTVFMSCTRLHTVHMDFVRIPDTLLCGIAKHCPHIVNFSMVQSRGFTVVGILAIAATLKTLTVEGGAGEFSYLALALLREKYPRLHIDAQQEDFQDIFWG